MYKKQSVWLWQATHTLGYQGVDYQLALWTECVSKNLPTHYVNKRKIKVAQKRATDKKNKKWRRK